MNKIKNIVFSLLFLFIIGCGTLDTKMMLSEYENAEEIKELLLAFSEREKYYSYGFEVGSFQKEGYVNVEIEDFQTLDEVKEYFFIVCTEGFCEKRQMFTGNVPRWMEKDGILFQSMADGMWMPISDEQLYKSTVSYGGEETILVQVPFLSNVSGDVYYMEYYIVETEKGLRVDRAEELVEE